jgi:tetratricopeptide (TPR) repeat protein
MQKFKPQKPNSLVQLSCPFLLQLALATAILNYPLFLQSAQAQNSSQTNSTLLSQAGNDNSVWNKNDSESFKFEQYRQAFEEYDKASRIKPNDPVVWKKRGDALRNLGRYLEAANSYDKATQLKPNDPIIWQNLGLALYRRGYYQDAVDAYKKAVELNPDDADALNWLGNSLRELGNYRKDLGRNQEALKLYQDADSAYSKAIKLPRQFGNPEYLYNRSLALRQQGLVLDRLEKKEDAKKLYTQALDSLNKSIARQPNPLRFYQRARFLIDLERYDEVLLILDNALKLASGDIQLRVSPFDLTAAEVSTVRISRVWHLKGVTLFGDNRYLEALEAFKQAIKLNAYSLVTRVDFDWVKIEKDLDAQNSWLGIAASLAELRRDKEALNAVNKAIELQSDYTEAIELRNELLRSKKE